MLLAQIDPNLFHLDWDRTGEVLITVVILSMLVERALSVVLESSWFLSRVNLSHTKEWIALSVSVAVCVVWDFDAPSMIILSDSTNWFGYIITGGMIAGGSKGSIRLFRDFLDIKSTARRDRDKAKAELESNGQKEG